MSDFTFNISLSVLNHLGRNLYRSFITVLGEAISNSWDADAQNVWIYLNRDDNYLLIKDDGIGMTATDFQQKFLKIGYSKRNKGDDKTQRKRPFIGRKGIGKLALLSCAAKITIISKTSSTDYIGGGINNSGLDDAINEDLTPQEYPLEDFNNDIFGQYKEGHITGTMIYFENIKDGIKNTEEYLKQAIALYFRFSLVDPSFNIFFNDEKITTNHLAKLAGKTQFFWQINHMEDPYLSEKVKVGQSLKNNATIESELEISGFIGSVVKPTDLKILTTNEKVTIDLFVNGRLRERDILKHMPSARIVESYLYGQIHYNNLDGDKDRFTSSREGIVSDDALFQEFLSEMRSIMKKIIEQWDVWRIDSRSEGDPENKRITQRDRKSRDLFNVISDEYIPSGDSSNHDKVEDWIKNLASDAQFNFSSYGECFISENLLRLYITDQNKTLTPEARGQVGDMQRKELMSKKKANLSFELRQNNNDLSYLDMDKLAKVADKPTDPNKEAALTRDATEYKPIRDAVAHTALLTKNAKLRLTSTFENIKARIKTLLS